MKRALFIAGVLAAATALVPPAHAQDAAAGKAVFKSICNLCHDSVEGKNRVGPSLYGVVGRRAGSIPNYAYSDVVKSSGITWNEQTIDKWISGPQAVLPGTKMTYGGLKDEQKRRDVIAFLKTLHH